MLGVIAAVKRVGQPAAEVAAVMLGLGLVEAVF